MYQDSKQTYRTIGLLVLFYLLNLLFGHILIAVTIVIC